MHRSLRVALAGAALLPLAALAAGPQDLAAAYTAQARAADAAYAPAAARGEALFRNRHGGEWSCASCHGEAPGAEGRHVRTGKRIAPLAPSVNAERFSDAKKSEKWFRRNCRDVLGRECSAAEKGDVLAFLMRVSAAGRP